MCNKLQLITITDYHCHNTGCMRVCEFYFVSMFIQSVMLVTLKCSCASAEGVIRHENRVFIAQVRNHM